MAGGGGKVVGTGKQDIPLIGHLPGILGSRLIVVNLSIETHQRARLGSQEVEIRC